MPANRKVHTPQSYSVEVEENRKIWVGSLFFSLISFLKNPLKTYLLLGETYISFRLWAVEDNLISCPKVKSTYVITNINPVARIFPHFEARNNNKLSENGITESVK